MEARAVRNIFASYFTSQEGHVPWQDTYMHVEDLVDDNSKKQRQKHCK